MVETVRVRSIHPWIHVNTVVFAADTIGVDQDGHLARVERDVVVTAIVPSPDGGKVVLLKALEHFTFP